MPRRQWRWQSRRECTRQPTVVTHSAACITGSARLLPSVATCVKLARAKFDPAERSTRPLQGVALYIESPDQFLTKILRRGYLKLGIAIPVMLDTNFPALFLISIAKFVSLIRRGGHSPPLAPSPPRLGRWKPAPPHRTTMGRVALHLRKCAPGRRDGGATPVGPRRGLALHSHAAYSIDAGSH
jgi:hypothetical protein